VNSSFKTPVLRNVALTAPYFHNGSVLTLAELVDFYARAGNFANAEQAKAMTAPGVLGAADRADLVDFLQNALTDPQLPRLPAGTRAS
jgi:cytochrome c peroxidase